MNRTILLRHLSNSSLAGQSREFRQERIRVGRKSDNDVIFNPEQDRLVSGHHCEIVVQGDDIFVVDPGSTNGTYVNGQRVQGRQQISERDQIMLGEKGPTFAVGYVDGDASAGPRTIMGVVPAGGVPQVGLAPAAATGLLDAAATDLYAGSTQRGATAAAATAAPPRQAYSLEAPGPVAPKSATTSGVTASGVQRAASRISQGNKTHIGFQTLMLELDKATKRERKRVFVLAAPIIAVLLGGIALAWHLTSKSDTPAAPPAVAVQPASTPTPLPPSWAAVLPHCSQSVYVVVTRKQGRADSGVGTAWSVGKGQLATNAHVAQAFFDLEEGEYLVARSNSDHPKDLKITAALQHPGYLAFKRMNNAHFPLNPESGKKILYATPFDVALLTVAEADIPQQAPPLQLADNATIMSIAEPTDIAYVGYPMDDAIGGGLNIERPRPQQFIGTVTRKTDSFMGNTSDEKAIILQYAVPVQGGASGSPVFNQKGQVIGLVSGNDHAFLPGMRIPISGKAYGPRADAVRELLEKTADVKTAPFIPEWRNFLRSRFNEAREAKLYDSLSKTVANASLDVVRPPNANGGRLDRVVAQSEVTISEAGDVGKKELRYEVTDAGYYVVVVTTTDPDLSPVVMAPEVEARLVTNGNSAAKLNRIRESKLGAGWPVTGTYAARLAPGETLTYTVAGKGTLTMPVTMKVQIWRATP